MAGVASALLTFAATTSAAAPTTAGNQLTAQQDAEHLLGLVALPSGAASLSSEPEGDGGLLAGPPLSPATSALVDQSSLWRVPASLGSVVDFIESHPPAGAKWFQGPQWGGPGLPPNDALSAFFPAIPRELSDRELTVTATALPDGSTGVRIDAQVVWVVTRLPSETVPPGVREIDIRSVVFGDPPIVSLSVTKGAKVRGIVRWIDALGVVQPAMYFCPGRTYRAPRVTFAFRAGSGALLARGSILDYAGGMSWPCNPIALSILGEPEAPLIGGPFLRRVQRLLDVRFTRPSSTHTKRRHSAHTKRRH